MDVAHITKTVTIIRINLWATKGLSVSRVLKVLQLHLYRGAQKGPFLTPKNVQI